MTRNDRITASLAGALLLVASRAQAGDATLRVEVTNLPEVQQVEGKVSVPEPIPEASLRGYRALVAPAAPTAADQVTEAGTLDATGYSRVTLSLAGTLRGTPVPGAVGLLLVPDVPEILAAWQTDGMLQFAIRVDATIDPANKGLFASASTNVGLGFPRYRIFLFNTTVRAADAHLWAYLGGG